MTLDPEGIYKIARRAEWEAAIAAGQFEGSAHDRRDGFIHLSKGTQVPGVLQRYFAGERDLLVVQIDAALLHDLRWEAGKSEAFPHHYGPVPFAAMRIAHCLPIADALT